MSLTTKKYNANTKTFFENNADTKDLVEKLGRFEELLVKYNLEGSTDEETFTNVERSFLIGETGLLRIERAMNNRIYYISARKIRKAYLVGYENSNGNVDKLIIQRGNEQTVLPYREMYISKREAKRERRGLQIYHLDKQKYDYFFHNEKYNKHTFLIEVKKDTNVFKIYTKVLKAYWRCRTNEAYSIDELKDKYYLDIDRDFKKEKEKYLSKRKKQETI